MTKLNDSLTALQGNLQDSVMTFMNETENFDEDDLAQDFPAALIQELGGVVGDTIWRFLDISGVTDKDHREAIVHKFMQIAFHRAHSVIDALNGEGEIEVVWSNEGNNTIN